MSTITHTIREKALAALAEMTQGTLVATIKGIALLLQILTNFTAKQNAGAIPANNSIALATSPIPIVGNTVLVIAGISVQTQGADQSVQYALVRDGLANLTLAEADVSTGKFGQGVLAWIDQGLVPGSTHTWEITATNQTGGQTVTCPQAGQAWILTLELP